MAVMHIGRGGVGWKRLALVVCVVAATMGAWGQGGAGSDDGARRDLESCRVHRVTSLPGSHGYAGDFIEAMAGDGDVVWGLTADLSEAVPAASRAMYISRSEDGGAMWTQVARVDSRYFDARIGEGLRNGFIVAPGGKYFVITTQRGAFQVFPQPSGNAMVKPIAGPVVPDTPPKVQITKKPGEPVRANVVEMTADESRLIIGYGYFDRSPLLFRYRRGADGSWIEDGQIGNLPTEMDLLTAQFDDPKNAQPRFLYLGTGDQVFLLNLRTMGWSRVDGVGPDSAIHGMTVVGGLHLAACWGVYNPVGPGMVRRVTNAKFLLHRMSDEAGSNIRAYGIEVDARRPQRLVVTAITGVYVSEDSGQSWRRLNDLPDGEYRSAHFNADGTVIVSGMPGTFLVNPFSDVCEPRLKRRGR
ncbi:hypothetical protein [Edaphobacter aggregans]|uniref:hypothetical protein n=1 Tax=Edaphobacter aggregans TaxID=570835 RepID=UPI00054DB0AD|nr:hypothetical protein [Edaphobacter aggregans]